MKSIKVILLIIVFSITENTFAKSHFIVDMIKFKAKKPNIKTYVKELKNISKTYHGKLMVNPINIADQIETEVTPDYTSPFNYDNILIIRFDKKSDALKYTRDNYISIADLIDKTTLPKKERQQSRF